MTGEAATEVPAGFVAIPQRIARIVTEVFAPAVLATAMLLVVSWHAYGYSAQGVAWGVAAALLGIGVPFGIVLLGVGAGRLTDHHIGRREQRRVPLLIAMGCLVTDIVGLVVVGAKREIVAALCSSVAGLLAAIVVNSWWKVSIHTGVAAGGIAVLTQVFGLVILVGMPFLFLIGWSRVQLRDHTAAQTIVGAVLGALTAIPAFALLR